MGKRKEEKRREEKKKKKKKERSKKERMKRKKEEGERKEEGYLSITFALFIGSRNEMQYHRLLSIQFHATSR